MAEAGPPDDDDLDKEYEPEIPPVNFNPRHWENKKWTGCFVFNWIAIFAASGLMSWAVKRVTPPLQSLVVDLDAGLRKEFGFGKLEAESRKIQDACFSAVQKCEPLIQTEDDKYFENACLRGGNVCEANEVNRLRYGGKSADTNEEKKVIEESYEASLADVLRISQDKYLAMPVFVLAGWQVGNISKQFAKLDPDNQFCCAQIPIYCKMYRPSKKLHDMKDNITVEIGRFTGNDGVVQFNIYANTVIGCYGLPGLMVISQCFFSILLYKNGAMCLCRGGSCAQCILFIIPQVASCCVAGLLFFVFTVLGFTLNLLFDTTRIDEFPGRPTLQDMIEHLEAKHERFWSDVFVDLVRSLQFFRLSCTVFLAVSLFAVCHAFCFCIWRPYKFPEDYLGEDD